jgi:hypothetical protein
MVISPKIMTMSSRSNHWSVAEVSDESGRWRTFLDASAEIRAAGGGALRVPRRTRRASPFGRT